MIPLFLFILLFRHSHNSDASPYGEGMHGITYALGTTSRRNLVGVHPDLVRGVLRAIETTSRDFTVLDGGPE